MRKTIIYLVLAALLGGYVYFFEIKGEETRQAQKELSEKLIKVSKDSVSSFTINDFGKIYEFEKTPDGWIITKPLRTEAEESTIKSFLSSLTSAKQTRAFGAKKNEMVAYGLSRPSVKVYVKADNGDRDSLYLGEKTSIGSNMFVTKGDTTVMITPASLKTNAQKSLYGWRDKQALHVKKDEVRKIDLHSPRGDFTFEKINNDWQITAPLKTKAEESSVSGLLSKIDYGHVASYADENGENLARYDLIKPAYKLDLYSGVEKAKSTLILSKVKNNSAYGKDESRSPVFTVDSNFVKPFNKSLFDFRDKQFVKFDKSKIDRINFLYNNDLLMFRKDTTKQWSISTGEPIKNYKITDLVDAVSRLKVDDFVSESAHYLRPYGLASPKGNLEFFAGDGKVVEIEFGLQKSDKVYLRNAQTGQVVDVKESKLNNILLKKDDILDKTKKAVSVQSALDSVK